MWGRRKFLSRVGAYLSQGTQCRNEKKLNTEGEKVMTSVLPCKVVACGVSWSRVVVLNTCVTVTVVWSCDGTCEDVVG